MLTHPKCKDCGHSKTKHGTALVGKYVGWHKRRKIVEVLRCFDCDKFLVYGPTYEWEFDVVAENVRPAHEYRPDNLGYLERKYEKAERAGRYNQSSQEAAS